MIIRRHQTDNRGMTLVELLVAIVLLAIVVVPLLHTFVSSARANQKARERLRLTTAAQDIMEGLKADSIEELAYQFNYPDVSHASNPDIKAENEFHVLRRNIESQRVVIVLRACDQSFQILGKGLPHKI